MCRPTKVLELWERTRRALSHIHRCQVWWVSEFTAAGAAKNVKFLCVFVRHAFERQSLCARFRHEGVNDFDALVCSCAPVFNFIRLPAIGDTTKCRSPKNGKIWVLSLSEGDRINRSIRNLSRSVHHGSALAHAALNLTSSVKGDRYRSQNVKICPKLWVWATGSQHVTYSHEILYVSVYLGSPLAHKLTLISKRCSVQESPKCQNLSKIVVFGHGQTT